MTSEALFFGCWNEAGHYLFAPGGRSVIRGERAAVEYYRTAAGRRHNLDASLAPRWREGSRELCCIAWCTNEEEERRVMYYAHEYAQGCFLRHELSNGYSALQWWDRCQGDTRPNCNSTILLPGQRTTAELLAALDSDFPSVLANLRRAGVNLVEVPHP